MSVAESRNMGKVIPLRSVRAETRALAVAKMALVLGLILAGCLIFYFMILKMTGLVLVIELRIVDFLILGTGIFVGFHRYRSSVRKDIEYLHGLLLGFLVSAFATIPVAFFMAAYFQWIDPQLLIKMSRSFFFGSYISPLKIAVATTVGGMSWGMVLTFLLMQYFQTDSH